MAATDWVAINIEADSNEIVKQIQGIEYSVFKGAPSFQVLMSAASIALSEGIIPTRDFGRGTDITNKNLIKGDLEWFLCMLTYTVDQSHDLTKLEDRTQIVRTFEKYAQTGLPHLLDICKDRNGRDRLIQLLEKPLQEEKKPL
jgi:hypothetical protein